MILLQTFQYNNLWGCFIVDSGYIDNTTSGSRPQVPYGTAGTIDVYKSTNNQIYVKGSGAFGTNCHLRMVGIRRKTS